MERYVSILYEDDLETTVKKVRRKIIRKFNSCFQGCEKNNMVASSILAFLMSCCMHKYNNPQGKIEDKMFYPCLLGIDLDDLWMKIRKNLVDGLGTIEDYIGGKKPSDFNNNMDNLKYYMDDYCSYMIEARLFNDGEILFLDINDEEIIFFCKMCVGEFLGQLDMLDSGKSAINNGVRKRIDEILEDNSSLENKIATLDAENRKIKAELKKFATKKENIVYVEDKSRISKLNKEIKNKDAYIAELEQKVSELSYIKEVSNKSEVNEADENKIDFDKKFVFVGGCFNTVKQLKNLFKNAYFYDDVATTNKVDLTSDDVVVVYLTDFMSHAIYYRIRNMCNDVKQIHCNSNNIVRVLETIAENM